MVSILQPRNRLENGRGKNDEVPRGMWEAVEAGLRKSGWEKQKKEEAKEEARKKQEKKKKKTKQKKEKMMEVKKVAEEWEI